MSQIADQRAEVVALHTMLDSPNEDARNHLMATLSPEHFHSTETHAAFLRVQALLRSSRTPVWESIVADISLPHTYREKLKALSFKRQPLASKKEAVEAAETLENLRILRVLYSMAENISTKLSEHQSVDIQALREETASFLEKTRKASLTAKHTEKYSDTIVNKLIHKLRKGLTDRYIQTGMQEFDDRNGGALRGTNFTIGAPSGEGKSLLAQCIAISMAMRGHRVAFYSLEMPEEMVWLRALALLSGVAVTDLSKRNITDAKYDYVNNCYKVFQLGLQRMRACFRVEHPEITPTMDALLAQAKPYGYDVIVIDYLSLLDGMSGEDFWRRLGEGAKRAQSYAIDTDSVVITVVQTDDEGKARLSKMITDNAGLMWVWGKPDKKQSQAGERPAYEKKGIDTFKIFMPKARMQESLDMIVYRSKAHMQVSSNLQDLQTPWVNKIPYVEDLFEQLKKAVRQPMDARSRLRNMMVRRRMQRTSVNSSKRKDQTR